MFAATNSESDFHLSARMNVATATGMAARSTATCISSVGTTSKYFRMAKQSNGMTSSFKPASQKFSPGLCFILSKLMLAPRHRSAIGSAMPPTIFKVVKSAANIKYDLNKKESFLSKWLKWV